jgi:hypothetical protein
MGNRAQQPSQGSGRRSCGRAMPRGQSLRGPLDPSSMTSHASRITVVRASSAGQCKRPPRVPTHPRGQNTRSSGATQSDKAVRRRPRAPIPVLDLGPKCVGPNSPRVLSRPLLVRPGPSRQRLQVISPSSHQCFPAARAPPPFRR